MSGGSAASGGVREDGPVSEWVVVMRFRVDVGQAPSFRDEATAAARLLARQSGCEGVELGRASDDATLWILAARWLTVGHYRQALSSYEVKVQAVPLMSRAVDEPTAFQVLLGVDRDGERMSSGDLAADAGTVDRAR